MAVRPSITIFMNLFIKQLARKPTILCTHPHAGLHETPANIASHIFRHKRTKPLKPPAFRWPSRAADTRRDALNLDRMLPRATREGSDVFTIDLIQELHREAMRHDLEHRDVPGGECCRYGIPVEQSASILNRTRKCLVAPPRGSRTRRGQRRINFDR